MRAVVEFSSVVDALRISSRHRRGKTVINAVIVVQAETDLLHVVDALDRRAASRRLYRGQQSAISTAMIAMTTSNSISVKPRRAGRRKREFMSRLSF